MDAETTISIREIAEALQMDTYDLSAQLVAWARETLPTPSFEIVNERGPMPLETFDERVAAARRYLELAHSSFNAWIEDNPNDLEDAD